MDVDYMMFHIKNQDTILEAMLILSIESNSQNITHHSFQLQVIKQFQDGILEQGYLLIPFMDIHHQLIPCLLENLKMILYHVMPPEKLYFGI